MDKDIPYLEKLSRELRAKSASAGVAGHNQAVPKTLREVSLQSIGETEWVPQSGENRILGMVEGRPDWVVSRQRAWGVPITVFVRKGDGEVLVDAKVNERVYEAMFAEGADVWFSETDGARFLEASYDPSELEQVRDVLDVWSTRGSRMALCWRTCTSRGWWASSGRSTAGGTASCIWRARTSIAAGSIPRCWNRAARVGALRSMLC